MRFNKVQERRIGIFLSLLALLGVLFMVFGPIIKLNIYNNDSTSISLFNLITSNFETSLQDGTKVDLFSSAMQGHNRVWELEVIQTFLGVIPTIVLGVAWCLSVFACGAHFIYIRSELINKITAWLIYIPVVILALLLLLIYISLNMEYGESEIISIDWLRMIIPSAIIVLLNSIGMASFYNRLH